jgi:hypothetical protein
VDGKKYTSDRIRAFGFAGLYFSEFGSVAGEFPVGKDVSVFYDPNDPSSAVLLHGPPNEGYIALLAGIGLFFAGLFLVIKKHVKRDDVEGMRSDESDSSDL